MANHPVFGRQSFRARASYVGFGKIVEMPSEKKDSGGMKSGYVNNSLEMNIQPAIRKMK